jgi:translation elongation factor EF-Tu-like GTPase
MPENEKWYRIHILAKFHLLLTRESSGRRTGITTGYRPNHNFGDASNNEMRMGQIKIPDDRWIEPGETMMVNVNFIMPEGFVIDLQPGLSWRIQEGRRHVGNGKVIRLISIQ